MNPALTKLLEERTVWRCRETSEDRLKDQANAAATLSTGYPRLDDYLPGGGWPRDALVEVLSSDAGIGELRLFMPALAALAERQAGYIVWVSAPYQPYAPALAQWGLDVSRVLVIQSSEVNDSLWASAEALGSGSALAVLSWLPELDVSESRRLQLAAANGGSMAMVFRPASARSQSSAASLRLALQSGSQGTEVDFFKVRGARPKRICNYDNFRGHWPQLSASGQSPYFPSVPVPG